MTNSPPTPVERRHDRRSPPVLSVISPTFNEAENVVPLLESLAAALKGLSHEVIIVDDDSPDRTWEIAETYAAAHPTVRVLRRFGESGLSSAVVAGLQTARGEVLAVIDADGQHDETILPTMVDYIRSGEADLVVGTRGAEGGTYGEFSAFRRLISWVAALIAKIFLNVGVSDPMSGFFAMSRSTFQEMGPRINPQGFKILLEFLGTKQRLRVREVGYEFRVRQRGETKLSPSVIRSYLLAVAELRLGRQIKGQVFLYALVGLVGFVVNIATFSIFEAIDLGAIRIGFSTPVRWSLLIGIQASILTNFLLNNYFTFWEQRFPAKSLLGGLMLFEVISIIGVVIHVGVFQGLQANRFGEGLLGASPARLVHEVLGFLLAFVSNYFLNVNYTWRRRGLT
jgi:dolichol-phosphate mannosyltransferase